MTALTMPTVEDVERLLRLSDARDAILRRLLDAERAAWIAGHQAGYDAAQRDADEAWRQVPAQRVREGIPFAELERRRWRVLCGQCRRTGYREGCQRCEDRDRATFGLPHPDDHPEGSAA